MAIEFLGLLALPFAFVLFHRLPDRGLTWVKPLSLLLFSYVLWISGLTQVIPNTRLTIFVILGLGGVVGILILWKAGNRVLAFLKEEWSTLVAAEAVFILLFLLWLGVASEAPAINHTEKPMDFGFVNAVLQSRYFPPEDHWLSGHSISYYYFGHFMMAFLTKLSAVPSNIGYNLATSLVPAMTGAGAFGLLYNLVRLSGGKRRAALGFGLLAPVLVLLIGNFEGVLEFINSQGWGSSGFWDWVGIKGLEAGGPASSGVFPDQQWWWWKATRVIDTLDGGRSLDYTITEFPVFSFLLGDLHPHVMSLPFLVLTLGLGLNLFVSTGGLGIGWLRRHPVEFGALALALGSLAFINTWDLPLMSAVLAGLLLIKSYGDQSGDLKAAALTTVTVMVPLLAVSVAIFIPFWLTLDTQANGVLPLRDVSTRPFHFVIVIGVFAFLGISLLLRQIPGLRRPASEDSPLAALAVVVPLIPLLFWAALALFLTVFADRVAEGFTHVGSRIVWVLPGIVIVGLATFSGAQRLHLGREPIIAFPLLLLAIAFFLMVGAELFYVADSFGGAFRRMNTVFKIYYQAWLLLGLVGTYGLYYWHSHRTGLGVAPELARQGPLRILRLGQYVWIILVGVLVVGSLYYSVGAVLDRTGLLSPKHTVQDNTLDGLRFIKARDPGEYLAIEWLRDRAPWGRMVEAVGDDYSEFGRISSSTGLPTVLGWKGHEVQWRGGSRPLENREEDVARIYSGEDGGEVRALLEKYGVRYVFLGRRERSSYGGEHLADFGGFLRTAFKHNDVIIYEFVNDPGAVVEGENASGVE